MDFKNILQDLLSSHDMKPADLCRETGIPTSLMSNYLRGTKSPGTDNSIRIANAFNISLDELAGRGKGKPVPNNGDELSHERQQFIDMVMKLDERQFQMISDIVDSVLRERGE